MAEAPARRANRSRIGKLVHGALYLHRSMRGELDPGRAGTLRAAEDAAGMPDWNVCRFDPDGTVGLLRYRAFEEDAFPKLLSSTRVSAAGDVRTTDYAGSTNPLILHRKELLVSRDHPRAAEWHALTADLIARGLFREVRHIGRLGRWSEMLRLAGLDDQGRPA